MSDWTWARREIAALDVERDWHRISHLSFVVRHGTPMFLHGLFSVAFVHNVGLPGMARILHRGGRGPILRDTHKRNFDSLTFFGELYRHGESEPTRRIAERLRRIHANFPIENDMSRYTLATLCCLPERISARYMGGGGLSDKECEAQYRFWRYVGELMGVHDIPPTRAQFLAWMLEFERNRFRPTTECSEIAAALAQEWADWWFPAPLRRSGVGMFYALVDPQLRAQLQLPQPTRLQDALATLAVKALFIAKRLLPDPRERHMTDYFGREYAGAPNIDRMGYGGDRP